jgi:hypothetical protein
MNTRKVKVRIAPVVGMPGSYVARYHADLLGATYSVEFHDDVMGGIAPHGFAEMLRLKWGLRRVELVLEDQAFRFRSKAAVDALLTGSVESLPPVWSQARYARKSGGAPPVGAGSYPRCSPARSPRSWWAPGGG